jgi:hypothetical protein
MEDQPTKAVITITAVLHHHHGINPTDHMCRVCDSISSISIDAAGW